MNAKRLLSLLLCAMMLLGMTACSEPSDPEKPVIYLKAGAESGNGSKKSPFGDVQEAIDKAEELALSGAKHVTLKFGGGEYFLEQALVLSGWGDTTLELVCEDDEKAVIGGWLPVTGFTETTVNGVKAWVADMPQIDGEAVYSHQFFTDDHQRLERPRYPEDGFLKTEFAVDKNGRKVNFTDVSFREESVRMDAFHFFEGDIPETLTRLEDVQVCMFHYWDDSRQTVRDINYNRNLIFMEGSAGIIPMESGGDGARYYLDNVYEYLNAPGEVYNDRESGKLYYIPRGQDDIKTFTILASTIDTLLVIEGVNGSEEAPALTITNVGFEGSDWKDVSRETKQGASDIPAAIQLSDCSYITFEDCSFDHIGNYAVELSFYVHHITFDHCSASDVGGGGFKISGENAVPTTSVVPHDITITDCTIDKYGRVHRNATGVLLQYAYDCTIAHNTISNGFYTGISVGWVWGYHPHATSRILVEKNHIYNIGQGLLSDMGGIYCLGSQPGTVLRGNLIHDIQAFRYGGWAYYTDEGSSDILIEKNIGHTCSDSVYHHHYGANNIVRNNIFAFGEKGGVRSSVKEDHLSFTFERNIVISNFGPVYGTLGYNDSWTDNANLLWDYTLKEQLISFDSPIKDLGDLTLEYNKENNRALLQKNGLYTNAVFADPLFADALNGDFTLAENSPAFTIGFEPIDTGDVGPRP